MKLNIKHLPKSEIEIEGELPGEIFESYFKSALEHISEKIELDGFRKGKVPEKILIEKVGEMHILEEMAELALGEHYPKILEEEKIDAIGRPEIFITKLARNNPLGFKIKTATLPKVELPDYKDIAKDVVKESQEEKELTVTDEEVENTIMDIRKSRAPKIHMAEGADKEVGKEGEEVKAPEPELPEFNDDFVKGLGPFENVADFKDKLKENIKIEKENQKREKTRLKIVEKIIEGTKVELPEILIDSEVEKILQRMESDIAQMGLKFEDYIKHINKTTDDLKKEFRNDGEKRAKLALVLHHIGKAEKITADPEQVANEVAMILEHYKEADPERARMHAENILTNEQIFKFLENVK